MDLRSTKGTNFADATDPQDATAFHQLTDRLTAIYSSGVFSTRQIIAGSGLAGGGTLSQDRTINIGTVDGTIIVNADTIQVGVITTANVTDDAITDVKIRNSAATSVIGRSVNSSGDPADILATSSGQFLRRDGSSVLGFGTILLSDLPTTFENPLTFTNGLTRIANTVSGDYITGKSGNQSWIGSTTSAGTLTLSSTSNATKGAIIISANQVKFPDGTTSLPALAFGTSSDRGILYDSGNDLFRWAINGHSHYITPGAINIDNTTGGSGYFIGGVTGNVGLVYFTDNGNGGRFHSLDGVFEQRNSTNPQSFYIYNTFTNSTNYERGGLFWSSNVLNFKTEHAASGSAREIVMGTNGNSNFTMGTFGNLLFSTSTGATYQPFIFSRGLLTANTANSENIAVDWNLSNDQTWPTGNITTQREFVIRAPTYTFSGTSTITNAATLAVTGAPVAGAHATLTNRYALWVQAGITRLGSDLLVDNQLTVTSQSFLNGHVDATAGMTITGGILTANDTGTAFAVPNGNADFTHNVHVGGNVTVDNDLTTGALIIGSTTITSTSADFAGAVGVGTNLIVAAVANVGELLSSGNFGMWGSGGFVSKPTVTGSKGGNVALANLISTLATYGIFIDTTT